MRTTRHLVLLCTWGFATARGQGKNPMCGDAYHYRWAQKTDTTLAAATPIPVDLQRVVSSWPAPALPQPDWCAPRQDDELNTYSVVGWVRVFRQEADSDWHVEMTATATSPLTGCMIAEIPSPKYGGRFAIARTELSDALQQSQVDRRGHVTPAVQVRFVGAAFFDGWHLTHGRHGDCNQQPGGLWEVHPVYQVEQP
jgi:hypothetical protein